jgi:hypothetical protein
MAQALEDACNVGVRRIDKKRKLTAHPLYLIWTRIASHRNGHSKTLSDGTDAAIEVDCSLYRWVVRKRSGGESSPTSTTIRSGDEPERITAALCFMLF